MKVRTNIAAAAALALAMLLAGPLAAETKKGEARMKKPPAREQPLRDGETSKGDGLWIQTKTLKDVPPGYRLSTIECEPEWLTDLDAGDRVDVLVTFDALMKEGKKEVKEKVTATILQNVLVYRVYKPQNYAGLLVNPNEAQYLSLAMKQGEITMIRRGKGDTEMHPMEMASFRKLFR